MFAVLCHLVRIEQILYCIMIYGGGGVWCPILYVFIYLCENKKGGSVGHHTSFAPYMCVCTMVMPDPTVFTFSIYLYSILPVMISMY